MPVFYGSCCAIRYQRIVLLDGGFEILTHPAVGGQAITGLGDGVDEADLIARVRELFHRFPEAAVVAGHVFHTDETILADTPHFGTTRVRNNFFTDYLWAVKGGNGDDLSSLVQAEVDYWDSSDP